MVNYATEEDIALRLLDKKPHWLHGSPVAYLHGENREFGKLSFDFGDEIVEFRIFIKDRETIIESADLAVANFNKIIGKLHEQ
jgi:hypothetical protein